MREGDTSILSPLLVEIILSLCLGIFLTTLIHILHVQVFVLQIFSLVGICHMVDMLLINIRTQLHGSNVGQFLF